MNIDCIIVDDEPLSQEVLLRYISDIKQLNLVAVCNDALEAIASLREQNVDLIFLDINMPRISGLQLIKSLQNPPLVIFTTAYPEFAVEGFEVAAVDFLLKPFSFDRFLKAVNKAFDIKSSEKIQNSQEEILWLKSDKKLNRVNIADIDYIEAVGDYVKLVCSSYNLIVHETMQGMMEMLKTSGFIRIHRSYIVHPGKIEYVEGNQVKIDETILPLGASYREDFFKFLKQ